MIIIFIFIYVDDDDDDGDDHPLSSSPDPALTKVSLRSIMMVITRPPCTKATSILAIIVMMVMVVTVTLYLSPSSAAYSSSITSRRPLGSRVLHLTVISSTSMSACRSYSTWIKQASGSYI